MPSPRIVRYVGLAAGVAHAITAYLGGAPFLRGDSINPVDMWRGEHGVLLTLCWVAATVVSIGAWWVGRDIVPSTRWAVVTAALWALPLLPVLPLGSEDVYSYACQGWVQYAGGDPYAAGVQEQGCPWVSGVATVWRDSPAPYGPFFLILAALAVAVGGTMLGTVAALRFIAVAGVALMAVGVPMLARRAGVDPARAAWLVLACPLIPIHLVSGAHNDGVMVGLLVLGLAVVASRPTAATLIAGGALLGLAVAVKATAVVVLPFAVLAAVPPGSSLRALWRPGAMIAGGTVGAMALVSLVSGRGLGWVYGLARSGDTVLWTSPTTAVGMAIEYLGRWFGVRLHAIQVVRTIALLLLAGLLVWLWWRARRGNALLGAALAMGATVALSPVLFPWYAVWPLALLAATWTGSQRTFTRWVLVPCAVAAATTLPSGYHISRATKAQGAWLITIGLVALAVWAIRRRTAARSDRRPQVTTSV